MKAILALSALALILASAPPAGAAEARPASAEARPTVAPRAQVAALAGIIEAQYVHPAKAKEIADALRAEAQRGDYDTATDPRDLAVRLTDRLRPYDLHFNIAWSATPPPARGPDPDRDAAERRENYGFRRVEVLPGNIGYLDLSQFSGIPSAEAPAKAAADAALAVIANTDAVIIDLRRNSGGSPRMVGYLAARFAGAEAPIYNRFGSRKGPGPSEAPTVPLAAPARTEVPLFILTSGRTASAGESLPYTLQAAKRAVVVGERTAGAANPVAQIPMAGGFMVNVPVGEPINPITHSNWEGAGVSPDVPSPASEALARAEALALTEVLRRNAPPPAAREAQWALEALQRSAAAAPSEPLAAYAGTYGSRSLAIEDGRLVLHRERWPGWVLLPLGGDLFAVDGDPTRRIRFERDGAGRVTSLVQMGADGSEVPHRRVG